MGTYIRLRGVTKEFDAGGEIKRAVDHIDLDVGAGEIVALLGPNGAGKTTTIDMILGFIPATSGEVTVFGGKPKEAIEQGRVSAVLQTGGLIRDFTVGETVELIASAYPRHPPIEEVLLRAGLTGLSQQRVELCSGGEQQRLRFALALLADPDLLLLDEPTAGMDVQARRDFWVAMREEAERGRTVVFATHYLQEAEDFAQRIVLLNEGRVVADGPIDEIRRHAAARTIKARIDGGRVDATVAALEGIDAVSSCIANGERLVIEAIDSDQVALLLLTQMGARDLEIEPASLESAFVRITKDTSHLDQGARQ